MQRALVIKLTAFLSPCKLFAPLYAEAGEAEGNRGEKAGRKGCSRDTMAAAREREADGDGFSIEIKLSRSFSSRSLRRSTAQRPIELGGGAIRTVQERALSGEEKRNAALAGEACGEKEERME
jgi:hypothetical protein